MKITTAQRRVLALIASTGDCVGTGSDGKPTTNPWRSVKVLMAEGFVVLNPARTSVYDALYTVTPEGQKVLGG